MITPPIPEDDIALVCWLVWQIREGRDREAAIAWAAKKRPEFDPARLRAFWPYAQTAVRNVALCQGCDQSTRLMDVPGIELCPAPE